MKYNISLHNLNFVFGVRYIPGICLGTDRDKCMCKCKCVSGLCRPIGQLHSAYRGYSGVCVGGSGEGVG